MGSRAKDARLPSLVPPYRRAPVSAAAGALSGQVPLSAGSFASALLESMTDQAARRISVLAAQLAPNAESQARAERFSAVPGSRR